jgi:hypothetical protein
MFFNTAYSIERFSGLHPLKKYDVMFYDNSLK